LAAALAATTLSVGAGGCGASDPLVGTWKTMAAASGQPSLTVELTFGGDHVTMLHSVTVYPTNFASSPGCTDTQDDSGFRWMTTAPGMNSGTLSYDGSSTTVNSVRTGCVNAADNRTPVYATGPAPAGVFASISGAYTVSADQHTLTITSMPGGFSVAATYTRA
jgi:hypothetical protein